MAPSALMDQSRIPDEESLKSILGGAAEAWFTLIKVLSTKYQPISEEWAFTGEKYGWSLRLIYKKRRIVYLIPQAGQFLASIVLGDKAVEAANKSLLPPAILAELNQARKYAEGRGIRLEVKTTEDLNTVELLAAIKVEN